MILDRVKGSLVGGAIGDALGYTVEFDSYSEILRRFGDKGITRLYTQQDYLRPEFQVDKGVVSDDTQMTFFTAYGLLYAGKKGLMPLDGIRDAYIDWYCTQSGAKFRSSDNWLAHIPALNVRRAPGMTCMTALEYIYHGQCASNNSKGCGGVMRVAPVGLWAAATGELDDEGVIQLAAQAARITHQHPLGYIPAGVAAHLVYKLVLDEHPTREALESYVVESMERCGAMFNHWGNEVDELNSLLSRALELANSVDTDVDCINRLGQGWVGDEALAIALFCVARHFNDFERAMIAAVNHSGDSDSTGAVAGNILGAAVGYDVLPQHFKENVEMRELAIHLAHCLNDNELRPWVV